jgi:hypothetical protein
MHQQMAVLEWWVCFGSGKRGRLSSWYVDLRCLAARLGHARGADELRLIAAQDELVAPDRRFSAVRLR